MPSGLSLFLIQLLVILAMSRFLARLIRRLGQPEVIGEIAAGIVLGPSILGLLRPDIFEFLFPISSIDKLKLVSQIGLIAFMFVVGLRTRAHEWKNFGSKAIFISQVGILAPFVLGFGAGSYLFAEFGQIGVDRISFSLFMGISMSITAFPVLARIIQERGLDDNRIGQLAMASSAVADVSAWLLLAAIISWTRSGGFFSFWEILILAILGFLFIGRLLSQGLSRYFRYKTELRRGEFIFLMMLLISSAFYFETIGVHALFGAYLAGVSMPKNEVIRTAIEKRMGDFTLLVLLPIFFAVTGLRTELHSLNNAHLVLITLGIIALSIAGKFFGTGLAARACKFSWADSFKLGTLMNTRGLMELIVLNIGLELGIISRILFTILVVMAVVTTAMTGPLLNLIDRHALRN